MVQSELRKFPEKLEEVMMVLGERSSIQREVRRK